MLLKCNFANTWFWFWGLHVSHYAVFWLPVLQYITDTQDILIFKAVTGWDQAEQTEGLTTSLSLNHFCMTHSLSCEKIKKILHIFSRLFQKNFHEPIWPRFRLKAFFYDCCWFEPSEGTKPWSLNYTTKSYYDKYNVLWLNHITCA